MDSTAGVISSLLHQSARTNARTVEVVAPRAEGVVGRRHAAHLPDRRGQRRRGDDGDAGPLRGHLQDARARRRRREVGRQIGVVGVDRHRRRRRRRRARVCAAHGDVGLVVVTGEQPGLGALGRVARPRPRRLHLGFQALRRAQPGGRRGGGGGGGE